MNKCMAFCWGKVAEYPQPTYDFWMNARECRKIMIANSFVDHISPKVGRLSTVSHLRPCDRMPDTDQ